jgi:hypothetical protein
MEMSVSRRQWAYILVVCLGVGVGVLGVVSLVAGGFDTVQRMQDEILKLQDIRERGEPTPYSTGGGNKQTVDQGFADRQEARDLLFEDEEDHGQVRCMRNANPPY